MDLKSNPSNDLVIESGDLVLAVDITAVAQRVKARLMTFTGEWFLDLEFGTPHRESILIKNPSLTTVSAVLKREIRKGAGGDAELSDFSLSHNTRLRELTVRFELSGAGQTTTETLTL